MNPSKNLIPFIWLYTITGLISWAFMPLTATWVAGFFLFFAFGNGTVGHRYFSHNSFCVAPWLHWPLAAWATLSAYSPISGWVVQHQHHHRFADTEKDIHSPKNGLWKSFFLWIVDEHRIKSVFDDRSSKVNYIRAMQDPAINFFSKYFVWINAVWLFGLALIDINLIWAISAAYVLEQFRLGIINTIHHIPGMPFNYRNHPDVKDNSQNNYVFGILSLGFGWHNNHHKNAGKLILTEHWWEIDFEGYLGWLLGLTGKKSQ